MGQGPPAGDSGAISNETSATSAAATPPRGEPHPSSWAGLISKLLDLLGQYKAVFIACLLFIALLAGAMWLTRDTSEHLSNVSAKQVEVTTGVLELQASLLDKAQATHQSLQTLSEDLVTTRQSLLAQQNEVAQLQEDMKELQTDHAQALQGVEKRATDAATKLTDAQGRIQELERRLNTRDSQPPADLRQAGPLRAEIERLREHLLILAEALVSVQNDPAAENDEAFEIALNVVQDHGNRPAEINGSEPGSAGTAGTSSARLRQALQKWADNPATEAEKGITSALAEMSFTEVEDVLEQDDSLPLWVRAESDFSDVIFIGFRQLFENRAEDAIVLSVDPATEYRDVGTARMAAVVRLMDPKRIGEQQTFLFFHSLHDEEMDFMLQRMEVPGRAQRIRLSAVGRISDFGLITPLREDHSFRILSFGELLRIAPELDRHLQDELSWGGEEAAFALEYRALHFSDADLLTMGLQQLPRSVQNTLSESLVALARGEFQVIERHVADSVSDDQLRQLRTAVLYPDFRVVGLDSPDGRQQMQQKGAPPEPAILVLRAEYGSLRKYQPLEEVTIMLRMENGREETWRIADVEFHRFAAAARE